MLQSISSRCFAVTAASELRNTNLALLHNSSPITPVQGWSMVCGNTGNGMGAVQHLPVLHVLAAAASGGGRGLLYTLLGSHHRQRHALRSAGQLLQHNSVLGLVLQKIVSYCICC